MSMVKRIVVIGCSGAGALSARTLKKLDPSLEVTIIREQEEKGLLTRCATPYIASGNVMVDPSYKDDAIFLSQGIKIVNVKAVGIDRKEKTVVTVDGSIFPYDRLVLATGAKPAVFPVSGIDLPGVFTLRRSGDAVNILHWVNSMRVKNAVVIGAGAIGIEIAYLFSLHSVKITLVEIMEHIMPSVLDPDMSEGLERYIRENGVELKLKQRVASITGEREVEGVNLSSGQNIKAEMVIISGGARSNVDLAKKAELEIGHLGLKVNEYLQTSDPDIYAAGDVIEYTNFVTGKPMLGQLRPNAVFGGRVAAKNILGYRVKFPRLINSFVTKFLDKTIAGAGMTESEAGRNGTAVVAVRQDSASKHSMMRGKRPYTIKLIFNRKTEKIIGGQIVSDSECPAKHIDVIAMAIRCGLTASELMTFRCAGQPELSPDPGMEPLALAAEEVWSRSSLGAD
jgi:NADH oxidase (H2O2-forming)